MSGEGQKQEEGGAGEVQRPDYLPESYFDPEAKTVKADLLKSDLAELPALREFKTAQETRAASLPKDAKDYKLELPKEFKIPEGKKFAPDENDPMVGMARGLAKNLGLDQSQFAQMVGAYGQLVLEGEAKAAEEDKAFVAEQNKLLGEKAEDRRTAVKTWMGANLTQEQALAMEGALDTKVGVEAFESIIAAITGTTTKGNSGGEQPNKNAELAENIGKPGFTAMDIFNAAKA